jgi:hypothetical protein
MPPPPQAITAALSTPIVNNRSDFAIVAQMCAADFGILAECIVNAPLTTDAKAAI